jgi:transcriptional regulator NrdR family protein
VVQTHLDYLFEIIEQRRARICEELQFELDVYDVINVIKKSYLDKITTYTREKLIKELEKEFKNANLREGAIVKALGKPITYLTKAHEDDIKQLKEQFKYWEHLNVVDYLITKYESLYEKLNA